ncbi:MAG: TonB-dependent receptor, partial [Parvularculaceae bacterium]|nr:TonB-dependent receptor [Parvularculaceae bacterium]
GSDAIAGVLNIILDDEAGHAAFGQWSQYYEDDGDNYQAGVQTGYDFTGGGFAVGSFEWSSADPTSRTRQRPDAIAFQDANPGLDVPDPVQRWGQPELDTYKFALNAELPVAGLGALYAFGVGGFGEGLSDFNWRNPATTGSAFNTSPAFPAFDLSTIYPAGFTPRFGTKYNDLHAVMGVRGGSDVFTYDFSTSVGRNESKFTLDESINASLGPASPTSFYLGALTQREVNVNFDFNWRPQVSFLAEPLNIAFGGERRTERYAIGAGDPASYAVGPGAASGLAPNSNGFPGFSAAQAGDWVQTSYAGYADMEAVLTDWWTFGVALRYEDFSEFGDNFDYRLGTRFEIADNFALRATYSTGFKAPTPAQLNSTSTSQGLDTVTLQIFTRGRLSPNDPIAVALGAKPLAPENSKTATAGLVYAADWGLTASVDLYQIDIDGRFASSPAFAVPVGVPNPLNFTSVSYFTNDFDTRTRGVDVTLGYDRDIGAGRGGLVFAYNYNETEVTDSASGLSTSTTQRTVFEKGLPKHNATATATYALGAFDAMVRGRYYGKWTDFSGNATGDIFQDFGSIVLVDIGLGYRFNDHFGLRAGAENVFNTFPDEATYQANRGLIYSRNAPYDTDGGQYYLRLDIKY